MATISTGILGDSNLMNLKSVSVSQIRPEVSEILVPGEDIIQCFQTGVNIKGICAGISKYIL